MNFFNRLRETLTHLDNALDNATRPQAGRPVFAVIDTETTGFNKRYDRIIEIAAVRADSHFNPIDSWHTLLNPDGKTIKNSHIHGITNDMVTTVRLPSSSGHPICTDLVSVGEDVHCESTAQEVHAGVPA